VAIDRLRRERAGQERLALLAVTQSRRAAAAACSDVRVQLPAARQRARPGSRPPHRLPCAGPEPARMRQPAMRNTP